MDGASQRVRGPVVVQKYGGSSLATPAQLRRVAARVAAVHRSGRQVVVVVSAQGDTTDDLLQLAATVGDPGPDASAGRELDRLLATGESASAALLALALLRQGLPAASLDGRQAGILVRGLPGAAFITSIDTGRLRAVLAEGRIAVVTGFQGVTLAGDVATLGRGGSDTSAVALAAALGCPRCEIYTDVDGVYSADPGIVPDAVRVPTVPSAVMAELAFAGAAVLHSRAVELAALRGIDLLVAHTAGRGGGSLIRSTPDDVMWREGPATQTTEGQPMLETERAVMAVSRDTDVVRVLVEAEQDLALELLTALAARAVPVDMVARSGPHESTFRMGFSARATDLPRLREALAELERQARCRVLVDDDVAKVSVVGVGLLNRPEHAARLVGTLRSAGIPTSWISTSQVRVSAIVPASASLGAVRLVHREFGLDQTITGAA